MKIGNHVKFLGYNEPPRTIRLWWLIAFAALEEEHSTGRAVNTHELNCSLVL